MTLSIGSTAPDFTAETTQGTINFHDWIGDSWAILFSHPKDYTPVCTTELGEVARLKPEFDKRNTKVIGLSVDKVGDHHGWSQDIKDVSGQDVNFPDDRRLRPQRLEAVQHASGRRDATPRAARRRPMRRSARSTSIGPDKKIKAMLLYPMSSGRNFHEILRLLDSIQLTAKHPVATPVNWNHGEDVHHRSVAERRGREREIPGGWKTVKPYLRTIPQPQDQAAEPNPPNDLSRAGVSLSSRPPVPSSSK